MVLHLTPVFIDCHLHSLNILFFKVCNIFGTNWSVFSNNVSFLSPTFRTVSTTPPGTAVNVVKRVTMETRPAAPAEPVRAGKSLPFYFFLNANSSSGRHRAYFSLFIFQPPILRLQLCLGLPGHRLRSDRMLV